MRPVDTSTRIKYRRPTAKAIRLAVASSTAIECDRTTAQVERRLRTKAGQARKVKLAD